MHSPAVCAWTAPPQWKIIHLYSGQHIVAAAAWGEWARWRMTPWLIIIIQKQHPTRLNGVAGGDRGNSSTFVTTGHVMSKLQITVQQPARQTEEQQQKIQLNATIICSSILFKMQSILGTQIRLNSVFFMIIIISICINQWLSDNKTINYIWCMSCCKFK